MALTQVSTGGIKDGQVQTADLADGQVTVGKLHADALDHTYTLGADGSNHYTFTGEGLTGAVNDPTLYLTRGKTYRFVNGNSAGAHPFRIQTTVNGSAGTEYNTGVTNNGGAGGSTIIFEVPHAAPDVLYYQCTSHGSMGGILYVTGALADGTVTTAKLAADAVTSAKIADDAVTSDQIASNSVTNDSINNNSIHGDKLTTATVSLAKLANGTSSNDGKFLRANNGSAPTFETVSAGPTVANQGDNRVITATGTTDALNAESNVVIDSNGRLGIGVAHNPLTALHVEDANNAALQDVLTLTNRTGSSGTEVGLVFECGADELARISGKHVSQDTGKLIFSTASSQGANPTEKMSIDADGKVNMSTTTSPQTSASSSANELTISGDGTMGMTLHTNGTSGACNIYFSDTGSAYSGALTYMHNHDQFRLNVNNNYSAPVMQWNSNLTIFFQNTMYSNGAAYSTGSDLRMKSNLVKFTNTLENLKSITGYKFDIKCCDGTVTRKSAGVIAQDVEKIYPEFVEVNPETGMKSLEYNTLIGVLVEAVKELTTRVEALEWAG